MKKMVFIFSCFAALPLMAASPEGIETNGGDGVSAEFLAILDQTLAALTDAYLSEDQTILVEALASKRTVVAVSTAAELYLDGVEKDAINHPTLAPPRIIISRKSWSRLTAIQKKHLGLHEMLPLVGRPDQDYKLSSELANKLHHFQRSNMEVQRAFFTCDGNILGSIGRSDLERLRETSLAHDVAISLCYTGLRVLANANWDFNQCDEGRTPLQTLEYFHKRRLRSDGEAAYLRFESLLLSLGATRDCRLGL